MKDRRVVVTGMGIVSPIGENLETYWSSLVEGVSGIKHIQGFETYSLPIKIAAEVDCFHGEADEAGNEMTRVMRFSLKAATEALKDAGLLGSESLREMGICIGSGIYRYNYLPLLELFMDEREKGSLSHERLKELKELTQYCDAHNITKPIVKEFNIEGPVSIINSACSSGAQAVGEAMKMIKAGELDVVLCGGVDSMVSLEGISFFSSLGVLSQNTDPAKASRPFDKARDGFVLGEGAGILILESLESALARKAKVWAEVAGYANLNEASHISTPDPTCNIQKAAILNSLEDAGLGINDVDFINAHGTSTLINDKVETAVVKAVFKEKSGEIPITANKSIFGHLICAAGAAECIATALSLYHGVIPPTINHENKDDECDLDYVPNVKRECALNVGISNSFAFAGQDVSIVLKKYETWR
ncbi:MAG: beta-ketoacyl-[acyl-carrier-protein] synthase family protein [Clostridia bacterium]|nr:beta-ketoacyl-[acyl-carrier-protein] synthase family protein [Clostridia bacterium]